jgi:hypothetical protein
VVVTKNQFTEILSRVKYTLKSIIRLSKFYSRPRFMNNIFFKSIGSTITKIYLF